MSMIQYFFENTGDEAKKNRNKNLFTGLKIMKLGEKYTSHMGKYPVINISLKSAKIDNFDLSSQSVKTSIVREYTRHKHLLNSTKLSTGQIEIFKKVLDTYNIEDSNLTDSLKFLSECLSEHFGEEVIILIDEYDVPLETAYHNGFYNQVVNFIRLFFEQALKTNTSLNFAVVTRSLRTSKESIFTGLNNFEVISIINEAYSEHYGFTKLYWSNTSSNDIDDLESSCIEALTQIENNKYEEGLNRDGFRKFIKYGVAFYKKECLVKRGV